LCLIVEIDGADGASGYAPLAAKAFFFIQKNAASRAKLQRVCRTDIRASRLFAAETYDGYEVGGRTADRANLNCALDKRVIVFMIRSANIHTGQTSDALIHPLGTKHSIHLPSPN